MGCEEHFCKLAHFRVGGANTHPQTALAFLNSPPLSQHHAYLLPQSIFITPAMEFRLGGFDLLTGKDDPSGVLWGLGGVAPGGAGDVSGPEVKKGGWGVLRE
jgi:SCY1-like protein 1